MTRLQFELKHGHLPAGCCFLGRCGRVAKRDARDITLTRRESAVLKPAESVASVAQTSRSVKIQPGFSYCNL
jgi:hypothetical protein